MRLIVPDPTRAWIISDRLVGDILASGGRGAAAAAKAASAIGELSRNAEDRLLSKLLDLNPGLSLHTPDGADVTHLYTKTGD